MFFTALKIKDLSLHLIKFLALDGCRNASKFEDALSPTSNIRPIIGQKQGDLVKQRQNMVQTPKIFEKLFSKSTPPATEQQVPYIDMDKDKVILFIYYHSFQT